MGKKAAHSGMSPKDRSINLMDKFITRNANREKLFPRKPALFKDPSNPIHMWPLKDQIEYWENRTDGDRFDTEYPSYSFWIAKVQSQSKVHPTFFVDCTLKLKPMLIEMYEAKTAVKDTVAQLRKHGVY